MSSEPPAERTTPAPPDGEPSGTQLSPAHPRSGGERVIALGVGGALLAALGLFFSTEHGWGWATASIVLGIAGVLLALVAAFLGFSRGHKNAAFIAGGLTTGALVLLILAIVRISGSEEAPGDLGTTVQDAPDEVLRPEAPEPE